MAFMFVSIFLIIDNLARKLFMWNEHNVQLTQNVVDRMRHQKIHKQKIVAYLFHEGNNKMMKKIMSYNFHELQSNIDLCSVRNPINNIALATELLWDSLDKHTSVSATPTTSSHELVADAFNSGQHTSRRRCPTPEQWEEIVELIDNIRKSTESARCVLDDALDIEKLASGSFVFSHKPFSWVFVCNSYFVVCLCERELLLIMQLCVCVCV